MKLELRVRKIYKSAPHPDFSIATSKITGNDWGQLPEHSKYAKYILEKEQMGVCAYTEVKLKCETMHIDHFKKRALFSTLTFDWSNLLVAERENHNYGACHKDDNVKQPDYQYLIDPTKEDPHTFFQYSMFGEIEVLPNLKGVARDKAETTIRVFNLNHPGLVDHRKAVIKQVVLCKNGKCTDADVLCIFNGESFPSLIEYLTRRDVWQAL